jgi:hypothetical protein
MFQDCPFRRRRSPRASIADFLKAFGCTGIEKDDSWVAQNLVGDMCRICWGRWWLKV